MSLKVLTMIIVASGILAGHSEQAPTARLRTHTQGQGDEDIQTKGRDLKQEVEVSMSMISNNKEMSLFGDGGSLSLLGKDMDLMMRLSKLSKSSKSSSPSATCGYGNVGNGACADPDACCGVHGWCDYDYCPTFCGDGVVGNGKCEVPDYCCEYGYCYYCGPTPIPTDPPTESPTVSIQPSISAKPSMSPTVTGAPSVSASPSTRCGDGVVGNCEKPTDCCSIFRYCGTGCSYCGGC